MLMKVRIRENIYLPTEFTTDWCESPITKKELCSKYNLNLEACDFYNDKGELVGGPELDGEQVTILQRPMGVTGAIIMGAVALAAAGGSIAYGIYQKNRAEERARNQKKLSNIYSYSLRGSTNDQRQYSPIPVVLGKVNVAGDKAGLQYSTYASNHQDVHQLICVGYSGKEYHRVDEDTVELVDVSADTEIANYTIPVGGVVFEKASEYVKQDTNPQGYIVRIADSPVDTFDNMYVDTQTGSDNNPTYYTERAIEISQMSELQGNPDSDSRYSAIIQTSPKNTIKIRVGVYAPYGYYKTNDEAEKVSTSYNYTVQYRKVGTSEWTTLDNPNGSMNQSAYRNLIESSVLSADQYQVRVFRNDYGTYYEWDSEAQQFKLRDSTNCVTLSAEIIQFVTRAEGLEGERGTRPIPYPGKYSLLSIKARANDRTNGWLEKIFTEVHLRCRTYGGAIPSYPGEPLPACTPSMWTIPQEGTSAYDTMNNPASVLLYILTCPQVNPRPVSYRDIDWESLRRWWLFCNDRGWTVNAFVTEVMSVAELAQLVCAAGRAHLVMSNNKFSVAIEDQTSVITQIFTPRNAWNMVQSKSLEEPTTLLKCAFVNDETEVEENRYIRFQLDANGNIDRTGGHVTIKFDDAEEVLLEESNYKSETADFWGVTNADQIGQLGAYQLYKGLCLNNKYTWECGLESLSCTVGDVVYLANDVFASSLGYGRIKGVKKNNNQQIVGVYIDESVEIHEGQTYGLTIRTGAGEIASKALFAVQNRDDDPQLEDNIVLAIDETNSSRNYLQFESPLPANSDVTSGNLFIYNDSQQLGKKVIIESIQPNSDRGATITAVDYIPEMYTIDIDTEIPVYKSTINKYGTGANIAGGYTRWDQPNEAEIKGERGSEWTQGNVLTGKTYARGVPGKEGDYYLNTDTYYIYRCITSGSSSTAYWQYMGDIKGEAGTTITEIKYGVSSSDSTEPSSWSSSVPTANKGDWLWVRTTYSNSDVQYIKSYIGTDGAMGVSITSTEDVYAVNNSSSTAPSNGWDTFDNVKNQIDEDHQYLWNKEIVHYSNNTTDSLEPHVIYRYAIDGHDGATISSIKYGKSASYNTEPSSWGDSVPSLNKGDWLWVKTTYSDSNVQYTKSYIGTDGDDGNSIYIQSATKTGKTTTVVIVDDDGHSNTLTIDDGTDGTNGTNGLNGYVHIAWANSADGSVDFSTSVSTGKQYIGTYTDNTQADSQSYSSYSWAKIKGETGNTGATGVGISGVEEQFAYGNVSGATGNWGSSSLVPSATTGQNYVWQRERVVYDTTPATYGSWGTEHMIAMWIKGDAGEAAKVFDIACPENSFKRNLRSSGYNSVIVFVLDIQGYSADAVHSVTVTGSDGTVYINADVQNTSYALNTIPYANTHDKITISASLSVNGTTVSTASKVLTVIDETIEAMYLGELSSLPDVTSTPKVPADYSYDYFLAGDYFSCVATNTTDNIVAGIPYEFNGTTWSAMQFETQGQKTKALTCLAGMLNSSVAIPSSTTLYAWIGNLVAQDASIANLFAQLIEVGNAIYGGNVNVNGGVGNRTQGQGFILDSAGVSEFSESYTKNQYAENINMIGTLNMYRNYDTSTDDAGADILHPAFSTTPAIEGDPTGISILIPAASGITTYDPTVPASKVPTANSIIASGISGTFKGNSITKMASITNASVIAIPASSGSSGAITPTITQSTSFGIGYEATSTFTVPSDTHNYPTKTISVTANVSNSWSNTQLSGVIISGSATLTVNGTTIGSTNISQSTNVPYSISVSGTASLGDTVTLKVQISEIAVGNIKSWDTMNVSWSTGSRSFSDVGMTTGLCLYSNNSWTNLGTSAITESTNRLIVNTPFYYNSQYFVLPSTLYNYSSYTVNGTTYNIELGRAYKAEGTLIIDGTSNIALNTFVRTSSGVMFYTNNGEYFFERGEQYYISTQANIKILGSTRGIAMEGCYPKKNFNNNGGYDCGTSGLKWNYGWFNVCNANQFNDTSRAEDKENIEAYEGNATELLNKVDIVTYNYKDDPEKKWHIGFLADYTPWEIAGVNHDSMIVNHCVGMLIKAVQELSERNKVLEEKIEKLTGSEV